MIPEGWLYATDHITKRALPDVLEFEKWTLLRTVDSSGARLYLLFHGRKPTNLIDAFTTSQEAFDFVAAQSVVSTTDCNS